MTRDEIIEHLGWPAQSLNLEPLSDLIVRIESIVAVARQELLDVIAELDAEMQHCEFDEIDFVCMPMDAWQERVTPILDPRSCF
jgi:hypothetical protein